MFILSCLILVTVIAVLLFKGVQLFAASCIFAVCWALLALLSPALQHPLLWLPALAVLLLLNVPVLRRTLISKPAYAALGKVMPPMSDTEREALDAGTTWWDKQLFSGKPDWQEFDGYQLPVLNADEQAFLDNEVNQLCAMLDEWDIHHHRGDLPAPVWQFLKDNGFFALIIPKQYGGRDFSPYAQSRVMSKIATRSTTAAVTAMVPNSLGPGELLLKYGTDEQKKRWLPGLADGSEIPCFGLTGPEAGSDAGAIPDTGVVCKGEHEGKQVIGIRLNFSKRWITLAPVATVVGLAFKLYDPDGLMGDTNKTEYGITCALIPADHPGVEIGRRHLPGPPFMNGPIMGENVFIPLDWIIGGTAMAGKGWRMLIECLGAGRGVSLPALATASGEMAYRMVGAFSRIRRQFNTEIGKFEGVQEVTAEIASQAYTLEAMRHLVTKALDYGTPSIISAIAKYHATEKMRMVINHGMDVVGGRAIQLGPRNFLALVYQSIPIAITVEGANILTRSLMIFGQGAMRCHPHLFDELEALQASDKQQGLKQFDGHFFAHAGHTLGNTVRMLVQGVSAARFSPVPASTDDWSRRWYQRINQLSTAFAVTSDMALALLGGDLKRREMISARLGDVLSELFISCSVLKYRAAGASNDAVDLHAELALHDSLYRAQEALFGVYANFPSRLPARFLKRLAFPFGRILAAPADELKRQVATLMMDDNPVRQNLGGFVYQTEEREDPVGRVEYTYQRLLDIEPVYHAFLRASARGELRGENFRARAQDAVDKGVVKQSDFDALLHYEECRYDALLTDAFDKEFFAQSTH